MPSTVRVRKLLGVLAAFLAFFVGLALASSACTSDDPAAPAAARSASRRVGPAGGQLELGDVLLTIPPGALSTEVLLTVSEAGDVDVKLFTPYSKVFRFEPEGLVFAVPITVKISYFPPAAVSPTLFW